VEAAQVDRAVVRYWRRGEGAGNEGDNGQCERRDRGFDLQGIAFAIAPGLKPERDLQVENNERPKGPGKEKWTRPASWISRATPSSSVATPSETTKDRRTVKNSKEAMRQSLRGWDVLAELQGFGQG
jgi:hypothetical protein